MRLLALVTCIFFVLFISLARVPVAQADEFDYARFVGGLAEQRLAQSSPVPDGASQTFHLFSGHGSTPATAGVADRLATTAGPDDWREGARDHNDYGMYDGLFILIPLVVITAVVAGLIINGAVSQSNDMSSPAGAGFAF